MANENFREKMKFFLKTKKITQKNIAERLGMTSAQVNNIVSGRERLGLKNAQRFSEILGIDAMWLMTQGEQGIPPQAKAEPNSSIALTAISTPANEDVINIPVLNLDVRGGLTYNNVVDVEQYTTGMMPFSRTIATDGDVVVPVYGDSMSPRYPSGSHILIRPLPMWREWLELGQSYVLELADYRRTIKIVRKGSTSDTYRLDCYNVDYDSTEIPKSMIEHIWQVLAVVKREVM